MFRLSVKYFFCPGDLLLHGMNRRPAFTDPFLHTGLKIYSLIYILSKQRGIVLIGFQRKSLKHISFLHTFMHDLTGELIGVPERKAFTHQIICQIRGIDKSGLCRAQHILHSDGHSARRVLQARRRTRQSQRRPLRAHDLRRRGL